MCKLLAQQKCVEVVSRTGKDHSSVLEMISSYKEFLAMLEHYVC